MASKNTFYTRGKWSGKKAVVHKYTCKDCGRDTIRSDRDAVKDNNLDKLRKMHSQELKMTLRFDGRILCN